MIFIVIPVFNRWNYTRECLKSLRAQTYTAFKIIVVDHGSTDGTSEQITEQFPEVILVKGSENLWWTGATNLGIQKALECSSNNDDKIMVLNNDLVVDPDYLTEISRVFEMAAPAVVGSLSVDIEDESRVDFAGVSWNRYTASYRKNAEVSLPLEKLKALDFVASDLLPGRGTLYPIALFREIGLFDEERFPHYAADEDFSFQCARRNYRLLVSTKAIVRSHLKSTGLNIRHHKVGMKDFLKTLSSIRSANNLKVRFRWARKNSPVSYFYFSMDVLRIVGSYIVSRIK